MTDPAIIKRTLLVLSVFTVLSACKHNPADDRLVQLEVVIRKWENELHHKHIGFQDLVHIQTDITIYDVDQPAFQSVYGILSTKQQRKLTDLRTRFKKLLNKDN